MKYGKSKSKRGGKSYSKKSKSSGKSSSSKSRAKRYNNYLIGNRGGVRL